MSNTLGSRISENRKRMGITQDQLAEDMNITAQAVSKWENDLSCPDISLLPQLADYFHTSVDELLRGNSDTDEYTPYGQNPRSPQPQLNANGYGLFCVPGLFAHFIDF